MVKKEIFEIKKLFTQNNCSITRICGCYVDGERNKKAQFQQAFLSLPEEEISKYLDILRKALSGTIGKNLHTLEFPMEAEQEGGPQDRLFKLRKSKLKDDGLLDQFYTDVIDSYEYAGNYLILVIFDAYDVPGKSSDGSMMHDASEEVYEYIMVCICPVKLSKPGLSYEAEKNVFHDRIRDWVVDAPETGFLFPAFNDRSADIHSVLYYSKSTKDLKVEFVDALLGCAMPVAPDTQKEVFKRLVKSVLLDDCSMEIVKDIQENIIEMAEEHKDDPAPLILDKDSIRDIFVSSGISEKGMQIFDQCYDTVAGPDMGLYAENIVSKQVLEVTSQGIQMKIDPDYADLVSQKTIDGKEYLLVELCCNVEINGIAVK